MNVLALFSQGGGGLDRVLQVEVTSPVSDVLDDEVLKLGGLDAEVVEGCGILVNDLVQKHALDLVRSKSGPVDELGELGKLDVEQLGEVDDLLLVGGGAGDDGLDVGHGVFLGAKELVGLAGGGVVVANLLEGGGHVDNVDRSELLLVVVCDEEAALGGDSVEELVAVAVHGCWSHNGGIGHDFLDNLLAEALCSVEVGDVGVGVGVEGGDVDESGDVVLCDGFGNALGALDMDVVVGKVFGFVLAADEVEDNVGVLDRVLNGLDVAQVPLDKVDDAEVAGHLEVALLHLLAEGRDGDGAVAAETRDKVRAEEAVGAKDSGGVAGARGAAAGSVGDNCLAVAREVDVGDQRLKGLDASDSGVGGWEGLAERLNVGMSVLTQRGLGDGQQSD